MELGGIGLLSILLFSSCNSGVPMGVVPNVIMLTGESGFSGKSYSSGSSQGFACTKAIPFLLPIIIIGDASIQKAAEQGKITKIDSVHHSGGISINCVVVRGEKFREELLEQR